MRTLIPWLTALFLLHSPVAHAITIPAGFNLIGEAPGLQAYRKDYPGGQPDFVLVVTLSAARVQNMVGDRRGEGTGPFGGPNPTFSRLSLRSFWDRARGSFGDTFAVVNAQFFSTASGSEAPLAFAVWESGNVSDGYGTASEFPGQMRLLQIDHANNRASITGFDSGVYTAADGPDFRLAGLSEDANKGPLDYVGRTFAGVHDANGDGVNETVLFFCSLYVQQPGAASVLREFGASDVIMFDGGGSSQLIVNGNSLVSSTRTIPHALLLRPDAAPVPVTCTDDCADFSTRCSGAGEWQECGQFDEDPCRDWSAPRACGASQECRDNRCMEIPEPEMDAGGGAMDVGTTVDVVDDATACTSDCPAPGVRRCTNVRAYETCEEQSAGCLGWSLAMNCQGAETCNSGICTSDEAQCPDGNRCDVIECGIEPVCGVDCGACSGGAVCVSNVCRAADAASDAGFDDGDGRLRDAESFDDPALSGGDGTTEVNRVQAGCSTTAPRNVKSPGWVLGVVLMAFAGRRRKG